MSCSKEHFGYVGERSRPSRMNELCRNPLHILSDDFSPAPVVPVNICFYSCQPFWRDFCYHLNANSFRSGGGMGSGHRETNNQHAEELCYFGCAAGSQRWCAGQPHRFQQHGEFGWTRSHRPGPAIDGTNVNFAEPTTLLLPDLLFVSLWRTI